jgi:hypothetical protein
MFSPLVHFLQALIGPRSWPQLPAVDPDLVRLVALALVATALLLLRSQRLK